MIPLAHVTAESGSGDDIICYATRPRMDIAREYTCAYIVAWLAACSVNCVSDTVLLLQVLVVPTFTAVVG